jgi:hypothetical protein
MSLMSLIMFYIIKVALDCKLIYILLIIENTMGRPHLKFIVGSVLLTGTTLSDRALQGRVTN